MQAHPPPSTRDPEGLEVIVSLDQSAEGPSVRVCLNMILVHMVMKVMARDEIRDEMKPSEEQEHNLRRTCGTCHCAYLLQDSNKALFIRWEYLKPLKGFSSEC